MLSVVQITEFFGWCSLINIGILAFTTLAIVVFNDLIVSVHSKILNIDLSELPKLYFKYLANYKIAILIFNLVPYIALKIMV